MVKVKGVTPLTAGVVPTTIHSQRLGKVNIYDFAGHEEYYASHEEIFHQTSQPVVLITVNISLPKSILQKQLQYWLATLSNSVATNTSVLQTMHIIIIGSHADQLKQKEKSGINVDISSLVDSISSLRYHGFIQCDCRYSVSTDLHQLREKLKFISARVQLCLALSENTDDNHRSASLMYYLKCGDRPQQVTITMGELSKEIRGLHSSVPTLASLEDQMLLIETCKNLSSNRHLLFLPHGEDTEQSLFVLDENVILSQVHACLGRIKCEIANEFGVLEESKLIEILSESLKGTMEPEQAIQYLILSQFCTRIAASELLHASDKLVHYFFPNLVVASRSKQLPSPAGEHTYTCWYTWCLKSSNPNQFFTHRLLHTLFIQLVKCEGDRASTDYSIWKNGILLLHSNGTRSIIEVTDQTTQLSFAIQCIEGCELDLVKQRSLLISLVKSLVGKTCPAVEVEEFLLLPDDSYPVVTAEVPIFKVKTAIRQGHKSVTLETKDGLQHIPLQQLIYFDSFHGIDEKTLEDLLNHSLSIDTVSSSMMKKIRSAVKMYAELAEVFENDSTVWVYKHLYAELAKFSIIANDSTIISDADVECEYGPLLLPNAADPLTISDLFHVNESLTSIEHVWKELGAALGLKQATLEKIRSRYLQQIDCCFTEVLAAWLNEEDRPHDSPGHPNWEEVTTALKSPTVGDGDLAQSIMETIANLNDSSEPPDIFTVDTLLDSESMCEVFDYVHDLSRKWFHLGLSLGLRYPTLKNIEASHHHDVGDHMTDIIKSWLDGKGVRGPPSWKSLAQALNCPLVRENQLAQKIRAEHCI